MIEKINLNNILFLDIETVPQQTSYLGMDEETKKTLGTKNTIPKKRRS